MFVLVRNVRSQELYFVREVGKDEVLVSWQECQRLDTFVKWCAYNNLEPKQATSLEKFSSMLNEESQGVAE